MKTLLVIDDDRKMRHIYRGLLSTNGFNVLEASNACDANELLKQEKVDLVLLDINMPSVDGAILYELIHSFHQGVKVIVASVYPLNEQKRIIHLAADYYDKSQGIEILLEKIRKAFAKEASLV